MLKKQPVKSAKLQAYEKAKIEGVEFELSGESVKQITLKTSLGPLQIIIESYSVALYEPAMRQVFRVTVTDSREQLPSFSKDFDAEYERSRWVDGFEAESGRFEVALSEFEEPAV